jgi:hypothetical protein
MAVVRPVARSHSRMVASALAVAKGAAGLGRCSSLDE